MLEQFISESVWHELMPLECDLLRILLLDRSTRKNLIWATDDYSSLGKPYAAEAEILPNLISDDHSILIRPRAEKAFEEQQARVREKAEVFTPSWVCNQQNNLIDEAWFGRKNVFNTADGTTWTPTDEPISFPGEAGRSWKGYVDTKRLEITCGEAPYLVSRTDVTTGTALPLKKRIGLLDRKLRVVQENTVTEDDWLTWATRATQSVYGFEFHGDSLLLARVNVFLTFLDHYYDSFHKLPKKATLELVARIISWNLWQMDGAKYVVPYSCKPITHVEYSLFGNHESIELCPGCMGDHPKEHTGVYCKVMDWREKRSHRYVDLLKGAR